MPNAGELNGVIFHYDISAGTGITTEITFGWWLWKM
jgi:hypothetical protein